MASKILAFRFRQIDWHTRMMSDRIPLSFAKAATLVIFSNHSSTPTSRAQFCGLVLHYFEVLIAQWTEVLVWPFFLLQGINCPNTLLQHQLDKEFTTRGCPNFSHFRR
jgi:hypothetical protein